MMRQSDAWRHAKPWLSTTPAGFATAVDRLKRERKNALFVVLTKAAAGGDWSTFNAVMERLTGVDDIARVLGSGSTFALALLYGRTGLPGRLYPLFEAVVTTAWSACAEVGGIRTGKPLRMVVLNKVFNRPDIMTLGLPADIYAALSA